MKIYQKPKVSAFSTKAFHTKLQTTEGSLLSCEGSLCNQSLGANCQYLGQNQYHLVIHVFSNNEDWIGSLGCLIILSTENEGTFMIPQSLCTIERTIRCSEDRMEGYIYNISCTGGSGDFICNSSGPYDVSWECGTQEQSDNISCNTL